MRRLSWVGFLTVLVLAPQSLWAIDAYIVAGQSNGWRISHLKPANIKQSDSQQARIHYFGMDCVAEPESSTMVTMSSADEGTMGYGLAQALAKRAGKDIVFIQYCRCGAPVLWPGEKSWWPGEDPANGKTFDQGLFAKFQKYLAAARAQVKQELKEDLEIKGLFWHQGESNVGGDKAAFESAVKNLFVRFRAECGPKLPIVLGHIRDLGEPQQAINAALDRIAMDVPLVRALPLTGLEFAPDRDGKPDVHIALAGCHELGRRMARSLAALELQAAVQEVGGTVTFSADDPTTISSIDLYNGNNPLKGKGGKNDLVNDAWLAKLKDQTSLKKLSLSNCAITNDGLKQIRQLTALEDLNLTLTAISDDGLQHLSELTQLRNLGLASSQCTGTGFRYLKNLTRLENVNFHFTPLNDEGLKAISEVGVSGRLWFAHAKFTDEGAKSLAKLKHLKICGIGSKLPESSGAAVAALVGLPLEDLSLLDNQASPEGIAEAAKITSLRRLDVSYAPKATDESLALIAQLPKLEELKLGGAAGVTDAGIAALAKAKSLKKLTLAQLKKVTEQGVAELKKARPDLVLEVK